MGGDGQSELREPSRLRHHMREMIRHQGWITKKAERPHVQSPSPRGIPSINKHNAGSRPASSARWVVYATIQSCGAPEVLVSDSGSVFRAKRAQAIYQALGIRKEYSARRQPWQSYIEIVFTQMTKRHLLSSRASWNDVTDLDRAVRHDHRINEQLDHFPALGKVKLLQRALHPGTEVVYSSTQRGHI